MYLEAIWLRNNTCFFVKVIDYFKLITSYNARWVGIFCDSLLQNLIFSKKIKNSTFFGKSSISLNLIAKQVHLFQWYVYLGHPGDDGERDIYLSWKLFVWASSEFW